MVAAVGVALVGVAVLRRGHGGRTRHPGPPRGGVEVAAVVAERLGAPLDVVVPRKVGAPGNPELGLGAVADGVEVLDDRLISMLGVSDDYLRAEIAAQTEEIRRREAAYRGNRPPVELSGKTAVVVDDGVATGGTAAAALRWARNRGARRVILAVPVAPSDIPRRLAGEADELRILHLPEPFYAVGQWYDEFGQVTVDSLLTRHAVGAARCTPGAPRARTARRVSSGRGPDLLSNLLHERLRAPAVGRLVVDDVRENRDVLSQMLTGLGCRVVLAQRGEEAVETASRIFAESGNAAGVVFLDVRLPDLDGREVGSLHQVLRLRRSTWHANLPNTTARPSMG